MTTKPAVRIAFAYEHQYRVIDATSVWVSKDGNTIVTGVDVDKQEWRSFRADRIQNVVRVLKDRDWVVEIP